MKETSVHISESAAAMLAPQFPPRGIRALPGQCILWFMPYRRSDGVLEIPEYWQKMPAEAIVIHDNTHHGLPFGTKILAGRKRGNGRNFRCGDFDLCTIAVDGMYVRDCLFSPEEKAA